MADVLPTSGAGKELIEAEGFGEFLLRERLLGEDCGGPVGARVTLWRVEQHELANLFQFVHQPFHGYPIPCNLRLFVKKLQ